MLLVKNASAQWEPRFKMSGAPICCKQQSIGICRLLCVIASRAVLPQCFLRNSRKINHLRSSAQNCDIKKLLEATFETPQYGVAYYVENPGKIIGFAPWLTDKNDEEASHLWDLFLTSYLEGREKSRKLGSLLLAAKTNWLGGGHFATKN